MIKKLLFITVISGTLFSCKTTIVPVCVSSGELASLNTGMSKEEAKTKLGGTYPFDILMAEQSGCELHHYKYKKPAKSIDSDLANKSEGLSQGQRKYVDESDAYILYKNGKLESIHTNIGKKDAVDLLANISSIHNTCSESGLKGCTDPNSLSYNPSAVIDDGSCEYCPCGYMPNPNFNSNRKEGECNQRCIEIENDDENDSEDSDASGSEKGCSNCDIIEKLSNSKANVSINLNLENDNNKKTSVSKKAKVSLDSKKKKKKNKN